MSMTRKHLNKQNDLTLFLVSIFLALTYHLNQIFDVIIRKKKILIDYQLPTDDTSYYLKRISYYFSNNFEGNPYLLSPSKTPHTYFFGEFIVSRIMKLISSDISITILLTNIIFTIIIFTITSSILYNFNQSRRITIFILVLIYFIQNQNALIRPVSPLIHLTLFVCYIYIEIIKTSSKKNSILKFVILILLSFSYPYFFLLSTIYFTFVTIYTCMKSSKKVKNNLDIYLSIILVCIFIYKTILSGANNPEYLRMLGQTQLRWPTGIPLIIIISISLSMLLWAKKKLIDSNLLISKLIILNMSLVLILISPVFTRKELEFSGHYGFITHLIFFLTLNLTCIKIFHRMLLGNLIRYISISMCLVIVLIANQNRMSQAIRPDIADDRRNLLIALKSINKNTNDIAVTNQENAEWVSLYSDYKLLWIREANLYPMKQEEIFERYFLNEYLLGNSLQLAPRDNRSVFGVKYIDQCLRIQMRNRFLVGKLSRFQLSCAEKYPDLKKQLLTISNVEINPSKLVKKYRITILVIPAKHEYDVNLYSELYKNDNYKILAWKAM